MCNAWVFALVCLSLGTAAFAPPSSFSIESKVKNPPKIDLAEVKAGGEIGRRIDITIDNNILVLDADKDFLKPFQERISNDGYIGLGKFIDSMVRLAANTKNEKLVALKNRVVEETLKTQEADGYIGIMAPGKRLWALWDIHEMNYLVNGLTSDYVYFHDRKSLDAAVKLMNCIMSGWKAKPDGLDQCGITVFMAVTGLEETLINLFRATGDEQYLDFCVNFRKLPEWDSPIVMGRFFPIEGHAYAYMHRCLAQLRLHQTQPDPSLLKKTQGVIDFLTRGDGLAINGVCSQNECWHNTQDGTEGLGETCATAYLIRLLDELIRMERNSLYGDIMERSIFNGLFAAQSPDGRRLRYYVPFEGRREYFDGDTYCCPCNYRRIVAELPSMIYYQMQNGVAVNLYASSEAQFELFTSENGIPMKVKQETDYPNSGDVKISVSPAEPVQCPILLRIPRWCEKAQIGVNGEPFAEASGGVFFPITREWKEGDTIELCMPMQWRCVRGRQAQAGRAAVMRGPQLFCLNPKKSPAVEGLDLRQICIDPATVEGPFPDDSVRPSGRACRVKGWKTIGFSTGENPDLTLTLTEFPDPDGTFTYFRIRKPGVDGVDDELMRQ